MCCNPLRATLTYPLVFVCQNKVMYMWSFTLTYCNLHAQLTQLNLKPQVCMMQIYSEELH